MYKPIIYILSFLLFLLELKTLHIKRLYKEKRSDYRSLEGNHGDLDLILCWQDPPGYHGPAPSPQGPLVSASQTLRRPGRSGAVTSPVQGD